MEQEASAVAFLLAAVQTLKFPPWSRRAPPFVRASRRWGEGDVRSRPRGCSEGCGAGV